MKLHRISVCTALALLLAFAMSFLPCAFIVPASAEDIGYINKVFLKTYPDDNVGNELPYVGEDVSTFWADSSVVDTVVTGIRLVDDYGNQCWGKVENRSYTLSIDIRSAAVNARYTSSTSAHINGVAAEIYVSDDGTTATVSRHIQPRLMAPTIWKNPGDERHASGSVFSFVATGSPNCESYRWYLRTTAGQTFPVEEVSSHLNGVTASVIDHGSNSSTCNINNVPVDMDGWKVYCVFTGAGEVDVQTSDARIIVTDASNITIVDAPSTASNITIVDAPSASSSASAASSAAASSSSSGSSLPAGVYVIDPETGAVIEGEAPAGTLGTAGTSGTAETSGTTAAAGTDSSAAATSSASGTDSSAAVTSSASGTAGTSGTGSAVSGAAAGGVTIVETPDPLAGITIITEAWSEDWSNDRTYHWHESLLPNETEVDSKAEHDMVWTETKAPTKNEDGEEEGVCSVCGYTETRSKLYEKPARSAKNLPSLITYVLFGLAGILALVIVVLLIRNAGAKAKKNRRSRMAGRK